MSIDIKAIRVELDRLNKYIATHDEEYLAIKDVLRAEHQACVRMRSIVDAAIEWSESFGELSKRLPPHVHKLRAAVDAYQGLLATKEGK